MKHTLSAVVAFTSVVALACTPAAYAARQSIRADLPYPYGGGGGPSPLSWVPASGGPTLPASSGVAQPFNYELQSGSNINTDDFGNAVVLGSSIQDVGYAAAVPTGDDSCNCLNAPLPLTQILEYQLVSGGTEFEFNYDSSFTGSTAGTASLTFGGVTYTSLGATLPLAGADSDNFVFNAAGNYIGSFTDDSGTLFNTAGSAPIGWKSSVVGGGGGTGGSVSAPEIDPASMTAALTLLAGGLAMLRSGRRTLKTVR